MPYFPWKTFKALNQSMKNLFMSYFAFLDFMENLEVNYETVCMKLYKTLTFH